MKYLLTIYLFSLAFCSSALAQQQDTLPKGFFYPSLEYDPGRFLGVSGGIVVLYSGTVYLLNEYWYKNYPRSSFHFFDDSKEWLQMDKAGHSFNAYFLSSWTKDLYSWAGVEHNKATWLGGIGGSLLLTTIEVLDGYSQKWGASATDFAANILGAGLFVGQELGWGEQRILLKFSATKKSYPDDIKERATDLFGNTIAETILKDYNALTFWASVNVHSFLNESSKFPKWLNVSVGYGAEGLFGGFENKWCDDPLVDPRDCNTDHLIDRTDIQRYRQYYLSLDIDLTKIKSKSPIVRTLLKMANIIKIPAPTLEYNGKEGLTFHFLYF